MKTTALTLSYVMTHGSAGPAGWIIGLGLLIFTGFIIYKLWKNQY